MAKLLIIDKKIGDLERYHNELITDGYIILTATSRNDGLKILKSDKSFDLIILGMETGAENGFRLLRDIRKIKTDIPILLNCEHTDFKKDFKSWLADDYMTKTSNMESLKSKVIEMIESN
ncbi:MAG: response regulator [candidate division Zixibacteria bacterium]|nr:response regulator [candidate division Zixibacteria bacterium]